MSLMHIRSGLCIHPKGGRPSEGVPLVYYEGCDQPRLKLDLYQLKGNAKTLYCVVKGVLLNYIDYKASSLDPPSLKHAWD